jgi:hypothetical protein
MLLILILAATGCRSEGRPNEGKSSHGTSAPAEVPISEPLCSAFDPTPSVPSGWDSEETRDEECWRVMKLSREGATTGKATIRICSPLRSGYDQVGSATRGYAQVTHVFRPDFYLAAQLLVSDGQVTGEFHVNRLVPEGVSATMAVSVSNVSVSDLQELVATTVGAPLVRLPNDTEERGYTELCGRMRSVQRGSSARLVPYLLGPT